MADLLETIPKALRALRKRAGYPREKLAELGGPPDSTVAKLEAGTRPPDLETVVKYLRAVDCDLHDLADAVDDIDSPRAPRGRERPEWITVLAREGIDSRSLLGFAAVASTEGARGRADLLASVSAAATSMAAHAFDRAAGDARGERFSLVAEQGTDYDPTDR